MLSRVGAPPPPPTGAGWCGRSARPTSPRTRAGYDLWRLDLSKRGAKPEPLAAEADVNENDPQIVGDTVYFSSNKGGDDAVWAVGVDGVERRAS